MSTKLRSAIKLVLRLAVSCGLLLWALRSIKGANLVEAAKSSDLKFVAVVWFLTAAAFWVLSYMFRLILEKLDCSVKTSRVFAASSVSMLYSLVLPGIMNTAVKWYILKEDTGKPSNILSAMVYNQSSIIIVQTLIGLSALIFTNLGAGIYVPAACAAAIAVIVAVYILLLNNITGPMINRLVRKIFRPFPRWLRTNAEKIFGQLEVFQTAGWRFHLKIAVICLFSNLMGVVIYIFAARAAAIDVPVAALALQSAVVFILGRLPISIANLGVRELTLIEFLKMYGVEPSTALVMSMIIFSAALFMAAVGAVYQTAWVFGHKPRQ